MPRPSLTEEMPDWVAKAVTLARGMVKQNATDRRFGYHAVVWLADRLTALETEIEGYRKEKEPPKLTLDEDEAVELEWDYARGHTAVVTFAPSGTLGWACLTPAGRCHGVTKSAVPSDLYAALRSLIEAPPPVGMMDGDTFYEPVPSALPCTSEYVNAQTGYDGEDGG